MRTSAPSPLRTSQVILGALFALILVVRPVVAQHNGGGGGHTDHGNGNGNGHDKHHDRSNPKPPKPPKDKTSANLSLATAPGATAGTLAGQQIVTGLRTGTLLAPNGRPIPPEARRVVLDALTPDGRPDVATLLFALTSNGNDHATKQAKKLIGTLRDASGSPDGLSDAVKAFNSLVDASSAQFLTNPPEEFLAIQAVLAPMAHEAVLASAGQP